MLADVIPKIAAELQGPPADYSERPSSAGPERCIRALTYHAAGIPRQPFPGRAMLIFDDSSWHEELTKDWIRKTAFTLHSEQMAVSLPAVLPWKKGHTRWCYICKKALPAEDLHGHPDGILTDLARVDFMLEHKAINHFGYDRIWKGGWPLDNLTQLAIYMRAVQLLAPELTKGLLLLKNKNTAQYMELLCDYEAGGDTLTVEEIIRSDGERSAPGFKMPGVVQAAIAKFAEIERYRAAATLPARPFELGTEYPCGYCGWAAACWDGYEKEYTALAEDAQLDKEWEDRAALYLEVSGHESRDRKHKEELRDGIVRDIAAAGLRGGRAGPYVIRLDLQDHWSVDQEQIPPEILERTRRNKPSLTLRITKPTPKPEKRAKKKEAADGEADPGPGLAGPGDPSS
jgi:hypothetical protein